MNYSDAFLIAKNMVEILGPYCDRIEVAGSVRRRKPECKDVEIVCIPRVMEIDKDLFGASVFERDPGFVHAVDSFKKIKGDAAQGLYMQRAIVNEDETETVIDIFTARPVNWGVIFAIRTGPAEFSHYCIAKRAHKFGLKIQGGMLTWRGRAQPVPEEKNLFDELNMDFIEPKDRGEKWVLDKYARFSKTTAHA